MFNIFYTSEKFISNDSEAFTLSEKSYFGEKKVQGVEYSSFEALYLLEKNKIRILAGSKELKFQTILKKLKKHDKKIETKYAVFSDMRSKGYIVKTALKFGADFRVYDKGLKPGQEHAKWILYAVKENEALSWHDFAAKNRVAHSTNKNLLLGIVDEEGDVSYYEISWLRP